MRKLNNKLKRILKSKKEDTKAIIKIWKGCFFFEKEISSNIFLTNDKYFFYGLC